jgi:hypothetical protein
VPLNPCGRVTDFARREYRTKVRFFKDSDQEVDVQVYRAAPGAPGLGFPSAFMSQDWLAELDEPWESHLGEVWGEPRPYSFHGPLIDPTYEHVCGTAEQFRDGVEFDPDRNVKYDDQGLPECCNGPLTPQLGVELGFVAELVETALPNTCATAYPLTFGEWVGGECGMLAPVWFKFPVVSGTTYRVTVRALENIQGVNVHEPDCSISLVVGFGFAVAPAPNFVVTAAATFSQDWVIDVANYVGLMNQGFEIMAEQL